jgi:hypothetical protein
VVHGLVGGGFGWMSDANMAARDPIFWLHHANSDRLWKRWLDQGGGRSDPLDDDVWMDTPFHFFDATGQQVTITAGLRGVRDARAARTLGRRGTARGTSRHAAP